MSVQDELFELEQELLQPGTRHNAARLDALLHDDFMEVGKSGRLWTKETCIAALLAETDHPTTEITSFEVAPLDTTQTVMLARWTMPGVRRSSIWVLTDSGWRMRYHQGTFSTEV
jgi:ribonuclease HI